MTEIVYKKGANDTIIVLEIPVDAKTNEDRKDISDPLYAMYRCDKVYVKRIYNQFTGEEQHEVMNLNNKYGKQKYEVGKKITVEYDEDLNNVCSKGIHYFKTEEQAKMYKMRIDDYTGKYLRWYNNGQVKEKRDYVNGKIHGKRIAFTGGNIQRIFFEHNYIEGKQHGKSILYCADESRVIHVRNYVNDEFESEQRYYNPNKCKCVLL